MGKRRTPRRAAVKPAPEATSPQHFTNVLLEEMRSQNRATIEAVLSVKQELLKRIDDLETRHGARLDVLESVVRGNSRTLADHSRLLADHSRLLADHSRLLADHSGMLADLNRKVTDIDHRLADIDRKLDTKADASLEPRVAALERAIAR